jgi:vacuolar iron transporter family protein
MNDDATEPLHDPRTERHYGGRTGWLRAAVLGANDGLVSTSSLVIGVSLADATRTAILLAGTAGLVAGAMSMAAGEYVSVSSQADTERADLDRERRQLHHDPAAELDELTAIYAARGVEPNVARLVSEQLMAADALSTHARDELGHSPDSRAQPFEAAIASALTFATAAAVPLIVVLITSSSLRVPAIAATAVLCLAVLGVLGAHAGGAPKWRAAARVTFWGSLAMAITGAAGALFGAAGL